MVKDLLTESLLSRFLHFKLRVPFILISYVGILSFYIHGDLTYNSERIQS